MNSGPKSVQRLSIPKPLAVGTTVVLAILVACSAYSIVAVRGMYDKINRVLSDRVPSVLLAYELSENELDLGIALRNASILKDRERLTIELANAEELAATITKQIAQLRMRLEQTGEAELVDQLAKSRAAVAAAQSEVIADLNMGKSAQASNILTTMLPESREHHIHSVRSLIDHQVQHMYDAGEDVRQSMGNANAAVIAATVLALTGSLLFLIALVRIRRTENEAADRRVAQAEATKAILVREVHHRIKNHLQGLLGLILEYSQAHPEIFPLSATLQGQIQSLSAVHGVCAHEGVDQPNLGSLLETQVSLILRSFDGARIDLNIADGCRSVSLRQTDAVPIALIVSELAVNALKHGNAVSLAAERDGLSVCVTIRNRNSDRIGFDFLAAHGLGMGLTLVRSLLPSEGAGIEQQTEGDFVLMTLRLTPPVIELAANE